MAEDKPLKKRQPEITLTRSILLVASTSAIACTVAYLISRDKTSCHIGAVLGAVATGGLLANPTVDRSSAYVSTEAAAKKSFQAQNSGINSDAPRGVASLSAN